MLFLRINLASCAAQQQRLYGRANGILSYDVMPKSMDVQLFKASLCLGTPVPRQKAINPNYALLPFCHAYNSVMSDNTIPSHSST